jgi:hypothetical protein
MDLTTIVADAGYIVTILNSVVTTLEDAEPFLQALYNLLILKQPLTDAQRAALEASEATLRAKLNAPSIPADAS